MLELRKIDLKEFKKDIYNDYRLLFPKNERKSYRILKYISKQNILKIYKIEEDRNYVGFMIFNSIEGTNLLLFDYFAIKPEYQNMGYGNKAVALLKEVMNNYSCIYGEVEKLGLGGNLEENYIREKRMRFYKNLGFYKLKYDLKLYGVIYTPICLNLNGKLSDEEILDGAFKIYNTIFGKRSVRKNCKIIMK